MIDLIERFAKQILLTISAGISALIFIFGVLFVVYIVEQVFL